MSGKRRHTVTTIESHEVWVIKRPVPTVTDVLCKACPGVSAMLTTEEAAAEAGVSQRTVFRWIDEGAIHFAETDQGKLFVCLAPLTIDLG